MLVMPCLIYFDHLTKMCFKVSNFAIQINDQKKHVPHMLYDNHDCWEEGKCVEKFN